MGKKAATGREKAQRGGRLEVWASLERLAWSGRREDWEKELDGKEGPEWAAGLLELLKISLPDAAEAREALPAQGAVIVVCNHPLGVLDGLLVLAWLGQCRRDIRILSAPDVYRWPGLDHWMIDVPKGRVGEEIGPWKAVLGHLAGGGVLVVFPSVTISRFSYSARTVSDGKWSDLASTLQEKSGASIVPLYIHARAAGLTRLVELFQPRLRTGQIPGKWMGEGVWRVPLRCGHAIRLEELKELPDLGQRTRFFRARTYALAAHVEPAGWERWVRVSRKLFREVTEYPTAPSPVVDRLADDLIRQHFDNIRDCVLFEQGGFACLFVPYARMGPWMHEVGRLRELTFRAVAEGTNEEIDLDEFDLSYHHLLLWDIALGQIAGAYRVGLGGPIFEKFGHRGFYTSTLFRMKRAFQAILPHSMELGRSFVPEAYQRHRLPLFLLWRGILSVSKLYPQYRYLIGPVSISGAYNPLAKWLMVSFAEGYSNDSPLKGSVVPRKPVKLRMPRMRLQDPESLLAGAAGDARKLDRIIGEIDPNQHAMPVLLRRYLAQNAKILAFNRDPKFNDAVDGLIVLDLYDLPDETRTGLEQVLR